MHEKDFVDKEPSEKWTQHVERPVSGKSVAHLRNSEKACEAEKWYTRGRVAQDVARKVDGG